MALNELKLVLSADGAGKVTGNLKDVEGAVESLGKKTTSATDNINKAWRAAEEQINAMRKTSSVVTDRLAADFERLKIKSDYSLQHQKNTALAAYNSIKNSGVASATEIERAYSALKTTLAELNRETGNTTKSTADLNQGMKNTGKSAGMMAEAWKMLSAAAIGVALGAVVKESIQAALQMERLSKLFAAAAGDANLAGRELEYVRGVSNRLGLDLITTTDSYGKFLAAIRNTTLEGEKGRKVFESVSGAATALGMSADQTQGVFLALSQMMSKGKVQAEELRGQLGERLPGAFRLAADAMGMTTAELDKALELGSVMAEDLLPKLADQLEKTYGQAAVQGANSAQAAINRMNNAMLESKSTLGSALMPVFTDFMTIVLTPVIKLLGDFVKMLQHAAATAAYLTVQVGGGIKDLLTGKVFSKEGYRQSMEDALENERIYKSQVDKIWAQPGAGAYTAADKLRQAQNQPTKPLVDDKAAAAAEKWASTYAQLRKEIAALNPIMSEHDKKLLDLSARYAELQRKTGANKETLQDLEKKHLQAIETAYQTAEAIKATSREFAEYLRIAGDESAWSQTADSVDEYHKKFRDSVEDMDAATKAARDVANGIYDIERAFAEAGQSTAIETFINNLFKLKDVQNSTADINISMADSDPAAQQMAAIEERYRREAELIQQRLDALAAANLTETAMYQALSDNILAMASKREQDIASIQRQQSEAGWQGVVGAAQKAFPKLTGLDKAVTAAFKDHTKYRLATEQERAAGAQKLVKDETRSNLSMYSSYAGAAGAVFEGLAATQDTTSRAGFETAKAFNIAAAVMNTAMAITNALATVQPYPAAVAAAAMAGVMGAIQIATIASTTFGGTAQAPTVPSGSFGASMSGSGPMIGSSIGANLQDPVLMANNEALTALTGATNNAALAIGSLEQAITNNIENAFTQGAGEGAVDSIVSMLANNAKFGGPEAVLNNPVVVGAVTSVMRSAAATVNAAIASLGLTPQTPPANFGERTYGPWGGYANTLGRWSEGEIRTAMEQSLEIQVNTLISPLNDAIIPFAKAFETAADAVLRLQTALFAFNDAADLAGITLLEGLAGANMASKMADLAGGTDELADAMNSYFEAVFTSAEKSRMEAEKAARDVQREFDRINLNGLNLAVPQTREEFRALVGSLDLMTDSGASTFTALMQISEAFGIMMDAADEAADQLQRVQSAMQDLDVRYLKAIGDTAGADALDRQLSAQREIEQAIADNMGDAYINRLREVLALEEQATANSSAAAALKASQDAAAAALTGATTALKNSFAAEKKLLTDAYNAELSLLNANLDAAKNVVSDLTGYVNKLRSASDRMQLQDTAYQRSQYAAAQAMLAATLVAARGGDLSALRDMDASLEILTNQGQDAYANSTDYQRDFWQTKNSILELEQLAGSQLSDAEKAVALAQDQISLLKTNHDAQLAAMDNQLNALLGINTSVLSVYDAINAFLLAQAQNTAIKTTISKTGNPDVTSDIINAYVGDAMTRLGAYGDDAIALDIYNAAIANNVSSAQLASAVSSTYGWTEEVINAWAESMGLPKFARGGITSGISIAGEAGPEAVVPLPDGRRIPVQMVGRADDVTLQEIKTLLQQLLAGQQSIGFESVKTEKQLLRLLDRLAPEGDALEVRIAA